MTQKLQQEQHSNIDWLTATCKGREPQIALYRMATEQLQVIKAQGNDLKSWHFKGYAGLQAQGYRWGKRADSSILVLSGTYAAEHWLAALGLATNVTRVDLATTVRLSEPLPSFAWHIYEVIGQEPEEKLENRNLTCLSNNHGGETFYVGSRISDQSGRLYDKGRENPKKLDLPAGTLWRYEVELKRERAKSVAQQLLACAKAGQNVGNTIAETVQLWFFSRGVPSLIWSEADKGFDLSLEARVTDDLATLEWLTSSVRPSVQRLIKKGKRRDVLIALGFLDLDKGLQA
jgi:hypothetical protein